jgi:MFS superfamily sulfate permease-like transporter
MMTIGATAIFLIARTALGDALHKRAGPWLSRMSEGFRENALSYLLVLRLVPVVDPDLLLSLLVPAFTLSVLASIDTLLTSVVADMNTGTRHGSTRELMGQGLGNIGSACVGGLPVSGSTLATMVNLGAGGRTPSPRNDRKLSRRITFGTSRVM